MGSNVPIAVNPMSGIVDIAGGYYHTVALKNDGTVWAWGNNVDGQLGDNTNNLVV
jgi:alpha-tubulin suppressor-like RCC1 family protein